MPAALFRRATAYTNLKEYRAAAEDFECVLQLEPNNKKVQEELNRLRKNHLETVGQQEQPKKGRRIEIEESDGEEGESSEGEEEPATFVPELKTGGEQEATEGQEHEGDTEGEKVTAEDRQEVPLDARSQEAEAEACDGAFEYTSNASIPSTGSDSAETTSATSNVYQDPAKEQETLPLDGIEVQSAPIEEQATPSPVIANEVTSQPESAVRTTSVTTPPQDEAPPPEPTQQEAPPAPVQEAPPPEPPPELPPSVKKLKEEGNDLFRRGQYGEAVDRYSKGITLLEKGL